MSKTPFERYDLISQIFHWVVVALLIGLFGTYYLHDITVDTAPLHKSSITLHMSLGMLLFIVVVLRILWSRGVGKPGPLPGSAWLFWIAKIMHVLLNLATLLIPIFGFLRVASKGFSPSFFGLYEIPSPFSKEMPDISDLMHILHGEPMQIFLLALIGLHILAALWHQFIMRDHIMARIVPGLRPPA